MGPMAWIDFSYATWEPSIGAADISMGTAACCILGISSQHLWTSIERHAEEQKPVHARMVSLYYVYPRMCTYRSA